MIIDGLLMFSQAQAITTASAVSTNTLDLTNARDLGVVDWPSLKVMINVVTTFVTADAATLTIQFRGSVNDSAWTVYASSPAIAAANLTAGTSLFPIKFPRRAAGAAMPRYVALNYVLGTGTFSAGALTSALVLDNQVNHAYPAGLTVAN